MRLIVNTGFTVVLLGLLSLGGCTPWQPGPKAVPPPKPLQAKLLEAAVNAEDLGIICEKTDVIGSKLTRVVCTTAQQREEAHVAGRQFVERIQNNALSSPLR